MPRRLFGLAIAATLTALVPAQTITALAATPSSTFATAMQQAAQTRQVPLPLIEATAYVNTRWEWIGTPAVGGGVGPMNVRPSQMAQASALSGHTQGQITNDLSANLDAGAALLAHAHQSGVDLASWFSATSALQGPRVATEIYDVLKAGASRTTSTGETITLAPQPTATTSPTAPNAAAPSTASPSSPDYPPAAWVPADASNYSVANRPHDYPVNMIIIHDIEGSDAAAIQAFQTPGYAASAHYVVGYNGQVTQMVLEKDIAWHAGNWDYNTRAIGIEHAGFAYTPGLYTTAEYQASAHLAASICSRWGVPMDRTHVIGHYQVPDPNNPGLYGGVDHHTDPGPYWDWTYYMSQAQSYANALPSPPHMMVQPTAITMDGGATISWQVQTCHTPVASFQVVVQPGNIVQNLPGTATSTTFTGLTNGTTYTVTVSATNADGIDSNSGTFIPSQPCTTPALSASPASRSGTGTSVTFTAATSGCTNPTYRFWVQPPGGSWGIVRDYSTTNTFNWSNTANAGTYNTEVDVRQQTTSVSYEAVANAPYVIAGCTAASLTANPPPQQPPGTSITLTGAASCLGSPEYRFWELDPGSRWSIVRDYSPTATYAWTTTGLPMGSYGLEVDVRDQGSAAVYESVSNMTYVLGPPQCKSPTLTVNPTSGATGSPATFSATSANCPNPRYRFWVAPPGGGWSIAQDYSASNTFNWAGGGAAGSYRIEVDVRDQLSTTSYDSVFNLTYAVGGCTAATLTPNKASPQGTGTSSVVLTATATCPGTPDYRFWIKAPGGAWSIVQDYSPTATYTWNTAALAAGVYGLEVDVRDHGSTGTYEAVTNLTFTLAGCTSAALATNKPSPQTAGTTIVLTGSATCLGSPQYRFWVRAQGGAWKIVQDYGNANTFSWTPQTAGTYYLEVDVRNAGSTATYETVSNLTFVVN